jgi:hypothetical protein
MSTARGDDARGRGQERGIGRETEWPDYERGYAVCVRRLRFAAALRGIAARRGGFATSPAI